MGCCGRPPRDRSGGLRPAARRPRPPPDEGVLGAVGRRGQGGRGRGAVCPPPRRRSNRSTARPTCPQVQDGLRLAGARPRSTCFLRPGVRAHRRRWVRHRGVCGVRRWRHGDNHSRAGHLPAAGQPDRLGALRRGRARRRGGHRHLPRPRRSHRSGPRPPEVPDRLPGWTLRRPTCRPGCPSGACRWRRPALPAWTDDDEHLGWHEQADGPARHRRRRRAHRRRRPRDRAAGRAPAAQRAGHPGGQRAGARGAADAAPRTCCSPV